MLDDLRPAQRGITSLYQRLVRERAVPELGYFLLVFSRPWWWNNLQALRERFFPSRDFLTLRYGARSRWGRVWIRLVRPPYLLFRGGRLLFRMIHRLLFRRTA